MLCRDGTFRRQSLAFRHGNSYGFQFEPQLTLDELKIWNQELASDYELMGPLFDPKFEAEANLREFANYSPIYEAQSRDMLIAFCENAGLVLSPWWCVARVPLSSLIHGRRIQQHRRRKCLRHRPPRSSATSP